MIKKALTTHDIAEFCDVTPRTVIQWISEGKINAYRTPGKHSRVKREDFLIFLNEYNMPIPEELKSDKSKKRILIVDDDEAMVQSIKRALTLEKNYSIDFAFDGFEAGKKFITHKPDLIILDLRMPKVDGFQLCKAIREDPLNKDIKILIISGIIDKKVSERIMKLGANEYLSKPFENKTLIEKIEKLANRS